MEDILKIVITGGPCAGKTTAMTKLTKFFESEGYHVVICNETARWLIESGIRPFGPGALPILDFQKGILDVQVAKEDLLLEYTKLVPCEKKVMIFDRGILDNRAYLRPGQFEKLAAMKGMTEDEILARYNMVIHLVSTAVDKEKAYITDGTRTETIEEAKELDRKTMETWDKHPNRSIFWNDCEFNEKIDRVINEISRYLGIRKAQPKRLYLIKGINYDELSKTPVTIKKLLYREFLGIDDNGVRHTYTETIDNEVRPSWSFTETYDMNGEMITKERPISREEYNSALRVTENDILEKTRYIMTTPTRTYKVDIYHSGYNFSTVEVEDTRELPAIFKNGIDITGNELFNEDNLLRFNRKAIEEVTKGYRKILR
jgi:predicted ATPase